MRRTGNLYNQIADTDNLLHAYWKAKRSKEAKHEVLNYSKNLTENIQQLRKELLYGEVKVGDYSYFTIHDPKERVICAASFPERVLHHAVMNVCHPVFERFQIFDSYATRPGKGQYAALERAKLYNQKNKWFCKLDIRKYFDTINHQILIAKLEQKIKDKRLLELFCKIIRSYHVGENYGIPIGNLTSQYFANFYLGFADHYIKEKLHVSCYIRYMDDMVFWCNNKNELISKCNLFISFIENELGLKVKPACIHNNEKGLPFLGYVLCKSNVRLNKNSKKRFIKKYNDYKYRLDSNSWTQKEFSNHVTPLIAFVQFANTGKLREKVIIETETC